MTTTIDDRATENGATTPSTTVRGADALCIALERAGVDVIFGYPGGASLPIYDALPDHPALRHVLVRHEQGAAHMADGYARVRHRPGVCMATSGPGATNLVTGLASAYMDSIPMVAITGQVSTALMGRDAEARALFERLLSLRNDVGLLAEEYDTSAGRQVGNFPQAFSHISLLNTAQNLSRTNKPAEQRSGEISRRRT